MAASSSELRLPGVKHKVICLVSGGKDSCFNLMHVVANGHEVVATGTLTPPPSVDELDSHMYQSVGTSMPPLIAKALGLPHFSRVIRGKAVEQGAEYGSRERGGEGSGREGDETEDLTALLKDILVAHPDATAVASGAILSNYQRLRIEHVCQRLGLTSLAYLWQSKQLPLVSSMINSGLDAILVKVAGVGLGEKHVGKSLAQLFPHLARLEAMYGAHPAGEGGEYESLTLDTPLFSHRLRIVRSEVILTDPEPSPVAYLRIDEADLVPKEGWTRPSVAELRVLLGLADDVPGREDLDEEGLELLDDIGDNVAIQAGEGASASEPQRGTNDESGEVIDNQPRGQGGSDHRDGDGVSVRFGRHEQWFAVTATGSTRDGQDVGQELTQCFEAIKAQLALHNLSLPLQATHVTLLLSSMTFFPVANAAYVQNFGTSPPSRATVAVPLPQGERVRVEVVGFDDVVAHSGHKVGDRSALHVQSASYWAPANIGPYSQAVTVDGRLHIAGQIPLRPASLTLPEYPVAPGSPYPHEAALALQHTRRIIDALKDPNATGGGWQGWGEGAVAWFHKPKGAGAEGPWVSAEAYKLWAAQNNFTGAPVAFVGASELPRNALVEYQTSLHTGRKGYTGYAPEKLGVISDFDEGYHVDLKGIYSKGETRGAYWETAYAPAGLKGGRAVIFLPDTQGIQELDTFAELAEVLSRAVTLRVYHRTFVSPENEPLIKKAVANGRNWTGIPVTEVRDIHGREYPLAIEVFSA
ncbi:hypothetical protein Q8F55_005865 [Vanrija albida]|uniref:Diphthine--ammonia ligase n=1 Tax=Vanrija albida TaxID=181172 RepID=A0ABR3Q306_9TREE